MYEYLIHNQATVIFNNHDDDDDDVTKIWRLPFHVCLTIHNSDQKKLEHNLKSQTFCQLLKYCCIQQSQFFFIKFFFHITLIYPLAIPGSVVPISTFSTLIPFLTLSPVIVGSWAVFQDLPRLAEIFIKRFPLYKNSL